MAVGTVIVIAVLPGRKHKGRHRHQETTVTPAETEPVSAA